MNAKTWVIGLIFVLVVIGGGVILSYNGIVSASVNVDQSWADIQVQYQRRADLIPQLVNATKTFINFEQKLLTDIAAARSAWTQSLKGSAEDQIAAGDKLNDVTSRLLAIVTVENYPILKSDQIVLGLMDELSGTENRIAVARTRYNEAVGNYNKQILSFPANMIAGMFNFKPRAFYQAS
ncbi:LemA family protein [Candidatus Bathyarchaeota archaeon]|nr:LemA family protein [Candidatus Bathyarchaeota archaeon]